MGLELRPYQKATLEALTADFGDLLIGRNHFLLLFIEYLVTVLLVMLESIL
jgi:hypothetical protein